MVIAETVHELINSYGWRKLPSSITSREGIEVDTSSDCWHLPYVIRDNATLRLDNISNEFIRWSVKAYIANRIEKVSAHAGLNAFRDIYRLVLRNIKDSLHWCIDDVRAGLIEAMESAINDARADHRLWQLYRTVDWYIWCAERYPELGFCTVYSFELEAMELPGNPKGEAVRINDPDRGPLHRTLEMPLILNALKCQCGNTLEELQEKAAMALSIAFGRNPANLVFLKEIDFFDLTNGLAEPCYMIRIPRIKKRLSSPRQDFLEEYITPSFASHLIALIGKNKEFETTIEVNGTKTEIQKPLFLNLKKNQSAIKSKQWADVFNMSSSDITDLLQAFVRRHGIISPITKGPLYLTARRLRYTLATNLVDAGISKRELARILDHTDTQHVQVYFDMAGKIVQHLDKAAAKEFAKYINFFAGTVIDSETDAVNGERDDKALAFFDDRTVGSSVDIGICGSKKVCHLDPPFSCYLCPKFQPYREADHEAVLSALLDSREEKNAIYEKSHLGIQLDEVIVAVANVVNICRMSASE